METLWWVLTGVLMAVGLAGTVLPLLPGTLLIFAAAVMNALAVGAVGWPTISVLFLLLVAGQIIEFAGGAAGAKRFGASRWGAIGGIAGAIVGIFFGLPGLFIGPIAGAIAGEILAGRGLVPAGVAGWGTLLGTGISIVAKFLIGLGMIAVFVVGVFWK